MTDKDLLITIRGGPERGYLVHIGDTPVLAIIGPRAIELARQMTEDMEPDANSWVLTPEQGSALQEAQNADPWGLGPGFVTFPCMREFDVEIAREIARAMPKPSENPDD